MRNSLLALGVGLFLCGAANAQALDLLKLGGVDPTKLINVPVDTSKSAAPIAAPQVRQSSGFSLTKYMPKVNFFNFGNSMGQSNFPTSQQMPGQAYLQAFGYERARARP